MSAARPVSLFAVGDVYFDRKDMTAPYRDMLPLMQRADIRFCNLEAPVAQPHDPLPERPYPLRSPPENLDLLTQGKFDAIAIAHNHLMDFGVPGMRETLEHLVREKSEELVAAEKEIVKAKRLSDIGMLAAFVAHELRNPLSAIAVALYNIKRKAGQAPIEKHLRTVESKIAESEQIINNLLFYARLKAPRKEPLDIRRTLEECVSMTAQKA